MESPFYGAENFEPKFFTGGPTRFYLPLFFDIVVQEKPARSEYKKVWSGLSTTHD